jgi:hypothetical protein
MSWTRRESNPFSVVQITQQRRALLAKGPILLVSSLVFSAPPCSAVLADRPGSGRNGGGGQSFWRRRNHRSVRRHQCRYYRPRGTTYQRPRRPLVAAILVATRGAAIGPALFGVDVARTGTVPLRESSSGVPINSRGSASGDCPPPLRRE